MIEMFAAGLLGSRELLSVGRQIQKVIQGAPYCPTSWALELITRDNVLAGKCLPKKASHSALVPKTQELEDSKSKIARFS